MKNEDKNELKGFARFSPRLRLLQKLSKSDDPIISIAANGLVRDKVIRRVGNIFEFIFLIVVPAIYSFGILWYVDQTRAIICSLTSFTYQEPSIGSIGLFTYLGSWTEIAGLILGAVILIWPGRYILMHERASALLRMLPLTPKQLFWSFFRLQCVSFLIYPLVSLIFSVAWVLTMLDTFTAGIQQMELFTNLTLAVYGMSITLGINIFIIFVSIYASLRFKSWWGSAIAFILGILMFSFIFSFFAYILQGFYGLRPNPRILLNSGLANIFSIGIAWFLAYTAIRRRIMPEK